MMTLSTADVVRLLPVFMRDDAAVKALANAAGALIREPGARARSLSEWGNVDRMRDAELDELAWERGITWYDSTLPTEQKREMIALAKLLKEKAGTVWAVKEALRATFGLDVTLEEWMDYNGAPRHFRLRLAAPGKIVDFSRIIKTVNDVKRASAILDGIEETSDEDAGLYFGFAIAEVNETYVGCEDI